MRLCVEEWQGTSMCEHVDDEPTLVSIVKAIDRLDQDRFQTVSLACPEASPSTSLVIGGGCGSYIVVFFEGDQGDRFLNLKSDGDPRVRVNVSVGGQVGDCEGDLVVTRADVDRVAAHFFKTGAPLRSLVWSAT